MRRRMGLPPVDGQRNVCHGSATLLDGMRELCDWFGYPNPISNWRIAGERAHIRKVSRSDNIRNLTGGFA
jgi:hypothetical protein